MKLTSEAEYSRAMREFGELEERRGQLSRAEQERMAELEGAIAAYAAEAGKPDRRKGRPPGKENGND